MSKLERPGKRSWLSRFLARDKKSPSPQSPASGPVVDPQNGVATTAGSRNSVTSTHFRPATYSSLQFWNLAYDQLKRGDHKWLENYERILNNEIGNEPILQPDYKQMALLLDKQRQVIEESRWKVRVGDHEMEVRSQVEKIGSAVVWANTFITSAVSADPHAALVWAGVSIIVPLLLSGLDQDKALVDGLDKISSLLCRFTVVERVYRERVASKSGVSDPDSLELRHTFEENMVALYAAVIEYLARATQQAKRSTSVRASRDIVKKDDWKELLRVIHTREEKCQAFIMTFNQENYERDAARVTEELLDIQSDLSQILRTTTKILDITNETLAVVKSSEEEQAHRYRTDAEEKCMQALYTYNRPYKDENSTPSYESQLRIPENTPGTCQWFTKHHQYRSWRSHIGSDVLWVSADPGCGKSTLAKYLVEKELGTKDPYTVCYFFFKDVSDERRSVTRALSVVLHQIFSKHPEALRHAMNDFGTRGGDFVKSFEVLWKILRRVSDDPVVGPIACIFDALDECEMSQRHLLMESITEWYEDRLQQPQKDSGIKFIATSRPCVDIDRGFRALAERLPNVHIKAAWESEQIETEINMMIEDRLCKIQKTLGIKSSTKTTISAKLQSANQGSKTYLWASRVLDQIEKTLRTREDDLLALLDSIPDTLFQSYAMDLSKSTDLKTAERIFHIVLCGAKPWTLNQISLALAVDSLEEGVKKLPNHPFEFVTEQTVKEICGFLITFDEHTRVVQFVHQTAKEFLLSELHTDCGNDLIPGMSLRLPLQMTVANYFLAKICLRTIMLDEKLMFKHDYFPDKQDPYWDSIRWSQYISSYWTSHVRGAELSVSDQLHEHVLVVCGENTYRGRCLPLLVYRDDPAWNFTTLGILAYLNFPTTMGYLIQTRDIDIDELDSNGQSALGILTTLRKHDKDTRTAMVLIENKASLDVRDRSGASLIMLAARNGHGYLLRLFLDKGLNLHPVPSSPESELNQSSGVAREMICEIYAERYPVSLCNRETAYVLDKAVLWVYEEVVRSLLLKGIGRDWPPGLGYTPLSKAFGNDAWNNKPELIRDLIHLGPDLDTIAFPDEPLLARCARTQLFGFSAQDALGFARSLLARRADVEAIDMEGYMTYPRAIPRRHDQLLRRHHRYTPLMVAAEQDFEEFARLLIENGASQEATGGRGLTALSVACENGSQSVVQLLLPSVVQIDARDASGLTALHHAAQSNQRDTVKTLLAAKAEANVRDIVGRTPLHLASGNPPSEELVWVNGSSAEVVEMLLTAGAEVNAVYGAGTTALCQAITRGCSDVVDTLLEHGATIDIDDTVEGETWLGIACRRANAGMVRQLLNWNAPVDAQDSHGRTALMQAVGAAKELGWFLKIGAVGDILIALHKAHANLNLQDNQGRTALSYACQHSIAGIVNLLLQNGARSDIVDNNGNSPLFWCYVGQFSGPPRDRFHPPMIKLLLRRYPEQDRESLRAVAEEKARQFVEAQQKTGC